MADQGKTEKPTQKRLEKARKEGNFVASREMVAAGQFLVFLTLVGAWFPDWLARMKQMLRQSLDAAFHGQLDVTTLPGLFWALIQQAAVPLLIVGALTASGTLGLHLALTRFGFSFSKLTPDFSRFNPSSKIKRIVQQGPASTLQAAAMLVLFGASIYWLAEQNAEMFLSLPFASLDVSLQKIGGALKQLLWKGAALFVLFGAIDLFRQYRRFMKDLRMSKLEIRDESKESEGNPETRGRIRRLRRDLARRRMMKEVATATTVIVNPTHYAVALRYRHDFMATPVVVAKGKNYLALRIRKIALENQIPLVENPPLAQALYKSVDVGREIPAHLYRAVAEVLAYIYRLTNVKRQWNLRGAGTVPR
jgi:flagellar biosynthesis protein FlhB